VGAPYSKPALTFEQQVALLEERGLKIPDGRAALATLRQVNYYRLSAYWYPLRESGADTFVRGASLDTVLRLYEYDRRLRILMLDGIERAEILARTHVAYELAHSCSPFAHAEAGTFDGRFNHEQWYEALVEELERSTETFVNHFRTKYDGFPRIPIWMACEVMSFGTLSRMFKGMQREHQARVAKAFDVHWRVAQSWLHSLVYVRNVCAHHARLWNRNLAIKPQIPSGRPEWAPISNDRVYAILCILRHLTKSCRGGEDWLVAARELLREKDGTDRQWERAAMGVPTGWETHPFWRS